MNTQKLLTFRKILLSYLVLCAVMIGITIIGFGTSISYMRTESEENALQELDSLAGQIEQNIQLAYKICDTLAASSDISDLSRIQGNFSPEEILKADALKHTMQDINLQDNLYQNLHLYFFNSNSLLSSQTIRREGTADMELFCKEYGMSFEEFKQILQQNTVYRVLNQQLLWLMRPIYNEDQSLEAVLIAEFKGSKLISSQEEDRVLFLHTKEGNDLACIGSITDAEKFTFHRKANAFKSIRIGRHNYIGVEKEMALFNWTCCLALPNTMLWNEMSRFFLVLALEIVVLIVAALLCSLYFSRKTFLPIGNLIQTNQKLTKKAKSSDTLDFIRYLTGVTSEFPAKNPLLTQKLRGDSSHGYRMAILTLGAESHTILDSAQDSTSESLESFVLENLLEEQIFLRYPGFITSLGTHYVILVSLPGTLGEDTELLHLFQEFERYLLETFQISLHLLLSKKETSYQKMPALYETLQDGIQYLNFWNSNEDRTYGIHVYGELLHSEGNVSFSSYVNGSRKLLNCLESEDFGEAYRALDEIYQSFPKNPQYLQHNLYRMYGLIGILTATLDLHASEADWQFYQSLNYEERLFRIQSIHELLTESHRIFEEIIQYRECQSQANTPDWLEGTLHYIETHFQDPDLNVSKLAEEFHLSVPHLSRAFKAQIGKGVLEYIHRIRLTHAKEMLKNDCTVKLTASQCGYPDSQAFSRAFKRYEGITPSQYKECISKNAT